MYLFKSSMGKNVDVPDGCAIIQKSFSQHVLDVLHGSLCLKVTKSINEQVCLLSNRIKVNQWIVLKVTIALKNA